MSLGSATQVPVYWPETQLLCYRPPVCKTKAVSPYLFVDRPSVLPPVLVIPFQEITGRHRKRLSKSLTIPSVPRNSRLKKVPNLKHRLSMSSRNAAWPELLQHYVFDSRMLQDSSLFLFPGIAGWKCVQQEHRGPWQRWKEYTPAYKPAAATRQLLPLWFPQWHQQPLQASHNRSGSKSSVIPWDCVRGR